MVKELPYGEVVLVPGRDYTVKRGHPWIFSGAIKKNATRPAHGAFVRVVSSSGESLGVGMYSSRGSIAIKMLTSSGELIDLDFWKRRIFAALRRRDILGLTTSDKTDAFRLIHAEGDSIPGLIVDLYARTAVIQVQHEALEACLDELDTALRQVLGGRVDGVYFKATHGSTREPGLLSGANGAQEIMENGLRFFVDWEKGQKTGFFLDQRENRLLLRKYACDRNLLNAFCYTGGFTVSAAAGGAKSITSLDSSKSALELVERNCLLNDFSIEQKFVCEDFFKYMQTFPKLFDLIILDPPAFAKDRKALKSGLKGYRSINEAAFSALPKGGILFTFSCSQLVSREEFRSIVEEAAIGAKRQARILHQLYQAPCHPINLFHPEGDYLKGLVLAVD